MSVSLVIVSDTHLPSRARVLPAPVWTAIEAAGRLTLLRPAARRQEST